MKIEITLVVNGKFESINRDRYSINLTLLPEEKDWLCSEVETMNLIDYYFIEQRKVARRCFVNLNENGFQSIIFDD